MDKRCGIALTFAFLVPLAVTTAAAAETEPDAGLRRKLLGPYRDQLQRIVFTKHFDRGGSHYAYTGAVSDEDTLNPHGTVKEFNFKGGSSLCLLEIDEAYAAKETTLLHDEDGVFRDPDVSYDGRRILFAWKKSARDDDYHLYDMEFDSRKIRQLTSGLGFADYEGIYLPHGDIMFSSTRCVRNVDCWHVSVCNMYLMSKDGKYMRRVGYDQVHTNYPQVHPTSGLVTYTRGEYNDRGQTYPQPLFRMYPNGAQQTEFYGNNSYFPTTILHARGIPGSGKVLAVLSGHHTHQRGKLAIIDLSRGRQETSGVTLVAPVQELSGTIKIDRYGQRGDQWQSPYPPDEDVEMRQEELDRISCWIDLALPHSGAWTEGMTPEDEQSYIRVLQKRRAWHEQEAANIEAYINDQTVSDGGGE